MTFVSVVHTDVRRGNKNYVGRILVAARRRNQNHNSRRPLYNASPLFAGANFEALQSTTPLQTESLPLVGTAAASIAQTTTTVFEPILPDTTALLGFGAVVVISIAAAYVWSTQVVPVSRTKLALSKKSGEVRDYLDELQQVKDGTAEESSGGDRKFEQWLFTDWLQTDKKRKKDPALPILKKAKWNSGDNPVLAATALIALGVIGSSVVERLAASIM
jgi:hypothetical protein